MKTNTYIIGFAVLLTFGCIALGWWAYELRLQTQLQQADIANLQGDLAELQEENRTLAVQADDLREDLAQAQNQQKKLSGEITSIRDYAKRLETEKSQAEKAQEQLEKDMNEALAQQEVTISRLKGKLTVNILDRIMFDSGKAELKEEGQALLKKVAEVLVGVPDRQVLVVGHTDNVPVTASRHLFATNWELSAARATAAVRFLVDCGVSPQNLGALGYGEHHPIADNATPEGRAGNRRIEVIILENDVLQLGQSHPVESIMAND